MVWKRRCRLPHFLCKESTLESNIRSWDSPERRRRPRGATKSTIISSPRRWRTIKPLAALAAIRRTRRGIGEEMRMLWLRPVVDWVLPARSTMLNKSRAASISRRCDWLTRGSVDDTRREEWFVSLRRDAGLTSQVMISRCDPQFEVSGRLKAIDENGSRFCRIDESRTYSETK